MKIFTIVVIYNGLKNDWIKKCFDSVLSSSIKSEIIAIDNNSTDESVSYIESNFPNVHLIKNNVNMGFGGANNQGFKLGLDLKGDYFFLLNQDATVETQTLEVLIHTSNKNPDFFVLSPIHRNGLGNKLDLSFSKSIAPHLCPDFYSDYVLDQQKKDIYEADFICAAGWLLPLKSLQKVGGFSPSFFHYAEDDNYCHRVKYYNGKIGVVPNTFINHDREDRKPSTYDSKLEHEKRQYVLWTSNPLRKISIELLIKQYRNKKVKYLILRDKIEYRKAKEVYNFLRVNEKLINDNYKKSISCKDYEFL
ncbi:glycosyltransferase family 2 protein [Soonwooa sp.]|uniref:glycosyltransferase family 2 protein n=1 Tax=Soonwooa sp. TaxID=1938592 RepID=UPI0028ACFCAB|nr:glycosyltransferase family 2 protein [Soonwooa sp.]